MLVEGLLVLGFGMIYNQEPSLEKLDRASMQRTINSLKIGKENYLKNELAVIMQEVSNTKVQ